MKFDKLEFKLYVESKNSFRKNIDIINFILDVSKEVLVSCEGKVLDTNIIISINKMMRVFYINKNSIHSMKFPFSIVNLSPYQLNWGKYEITLDIVYMLSNFFEYARDIFDRDNSCGIEIETLSDIFAEFMYQNGCDNEEKFEIMNKVVLGLLVMEMGYLRYDYDEKSEDGDNHPLHHLDIFYSSTNTFKIGLNKELDIDSMMDILDVRAKCKYI